MLLRHSRLPFRHFGMILQSRVESNHDNLLRRQKFYPLNYRTMVPEAGIEPARTLLLTRFSYHYSFHYHHCLWSGLSLNPRLYVRVLPVKSLHLLYLKSLARDCHIKGFPEFEKFYLDSFLSSTQICKLTPFLNSEKLKNLCLPSKSCVSTYSTTQVTFVVS